MSWLATNCLHGSVYTVSVQVKAIYKFSKKRKGDVAISFADNRKAIKLLNWKPKYTPSEGIAKMKDWLNGNLV